MADLTSAQLAIFRKAIDEARESGLEPTVHISFDLAEALLDKLREAERALRLMEKWELGHALGAADLETRRLARARLEAEAQ